MLSDLSFQLPRICSRSLQLSKRPLETVTFARGKLERSMNFFERGLMFHFARDFEGRVGENVCLAQARTSSALSFSAKAQRSTPSSSCSQHVSEPENGCE